MNGGLGRRTDNQNKEDVFEQDLVFPQQVDSAADFDDDHEDARNDVEGAVPAATRDCNTRTTDLLGVTGRRRAGDRKATMSVQEWCLFANWPLGAARQSGVRIGRLHHSEVVPQASVHPPLVRLFLPRARIGSAD